MGESWSIWVALAPEQIAYCEDVASKRLAHWKKYRNLKAGYSSSIDYSRRLTNEIMGCIGEKAACVWFNEPWKLDYCDIKDKAVKGLPDCGGFVQVKAKGLSRHNLILSGHQTIHPDRAYLSVCTEKTPLVEMVAWIWGWEITEKDKRDHQSGYPLWLIGNNDPRLKDADALYQLVQSPKGMETIFPTAIAVREGIHKGRDF